MAKKATTWEQQERERVYHETLDPVVEKAAKKWCRKKRREERLLGWNDIGDVKNEIWTRLLDRMPVTQEDWGRLQANAEALVKKALAAAEKDARQQAKGVSWGAQTDDRQDDECHWTERVPGREATPQYSSQQQRQLKEDFAFARRNLPRDLREEDLLAVIDDPEIPFEEVVDKSLDRLDDRRREQHHTLITTEERKRVRQILKNGAVKRDYTRQPCEIDEPEYMAERRVYLTEPLPPAVGKQVTLPDRKGHNSDTATPALAS